MDRELSPAAFHRAIGSGRQPTRRETRRKRMRQKKVEGGQRMERMRQTNVEGGERRTTRRRRRTRRTRRRLRTGDCPTTNGQESWSARRRRMTQHVAG
jgi:hypothetical protein